MTYLRRLGSITQELCVLDLLDPGLSVHRARTGFRAGARNKTVHSH